jgi:hypothetical protein
MPTRVLHSSRLRTAGLLALSLLFAAGGVLMVLAQAPWGWAVLGLGVAGLVGTVYLLLHPNRLELTARGLTTVTLGRRWSADWSQCGEFRTWRNDLTIDPTVLSPGTTMVVFDCTAPGVRGRVANDLLSDSDAVLPETYGMRASDLAALLNAYRETAAT